MTPIDSGTLNLSTTLLPGPLCTVNHPILSKLPERKPVMSLAMQVSPSGLAFIFDLEVGPMKVVTAHLHWPGGASGVTLGPGFDMKPSPRPKCKLPSCNWA